MGAGAIPTEDLRIFLLGGVRIQAGPNTHIDPGPPKCQELLAALALEPQVAITVGRLVALLWGVNPPRTADKTLQTYVARLRKALGADAIARTGSAYRLDIDPSAIDTHRFRSALRRGDTEAALKEWTGTPLAGVDADGLRPVLEGLVEEWLDAVESDLERAVEADPGATTGRLTELVAAYPFREAMWALLMTALYRTGRQAEALDAYRRARATLVDELGVEPGPQLRELEQLILQQDEQLATGTPSRPSGGADRAAPTGTVSFAFAELHNPARLWSQHPSHAADVIAAFDDAARSLAASHTGLVFANGADSVAVAFSNADDAADWSIALHETLAQHTWPDGLAPQARIGIHTGQADERNGSFYGPTVTLASQVAACSNPGQSVATSVTALLCSGKEQRELGTLLFEGAATEQELRQIGTGEFAPLRSSAQRMDQLPTPTSRLVGRNDLVTTVIGSFADARVVTLIGPGGVGKTRLAIEVARRDLDVAFAGIWFVGLAEVAEPADVARAVADAVGVQESQHEGVLDALAASLRSRPNLLVLDTCEHVVEGANELVARLTDRCPDLFVLATSREGLGLANEQLIVVGPLDADTGGVALFAERCQTHDYSFDTERHRPTIEAICRRLDGVPLAIELAAARLRSLTPEDLLVRLNDNFSLLTRTRRTSIERHRTIRATIQWSYELLSEREQRFLRRLSVFAGPFDLLAAEQVIPDEAVTTADVNLLIGDLIDQSMCTVESGTSGRRFRLLSPLREFAIEELHRYGPNDELNQRHAVHVSERVATIGDLLAGSQEIRGMAELIELWPNIRTALDWALGQDDLALATELIEPIIAQGFLRRGLGEFRDWTRRVAALAGKSDDALAGRAIADALLWTALDSELTQKQNDFGQLASQFGEPDLVFARLARLIVNGDSSAIIDVLPDAISEARARNNQLLADLFEVLGAGNLLSSGRLEEAEEATQAIVDRSESAMAPTLLNWLLYMAATARAIGGDAAGADALFDQMVSMALPPRTNSPNETLAARRALRHGDPQRAYVILRSHVDDLVDVENFNGLIVVALEFVNAMVATENLEPAAFVLGWFDNSALVETGANGFQALLDEPGAAVARDQDATQVRIETAARRPSTSEAAQYIAATLDRLLSV